MWMNREQSTTGKQAGEERVRTLCGVCPKLLIWAMVDALRIGSSI
jgi:hypothetical protein